MLRNRSRAVTSKQALMSDQASFLSPTKNSPSPFSSFFNSPRFFNGFLSKSVLDAETMSPTSILDSRNFSNLSSPFRGDGALSKPRNLPYFDFAPPKKSATEAIGLGLIDSIAGEDSDQGGGVFSKPINRMALLGSKLKVQIPELSSSVSPVESPRSPADFGIKTKGSQQQLLSPFGGGSPAKDLSRQLSLKEIEMSEDYTCVIKHGPNPKTRHIYDDCILNTDGEEEEEGEVDASSRPEMEVEKPDFLSFCHGCKLGLGQDKDIFIYRFASF